MYFKWVDDMVCTSHLNKTVIKKKKRKETQVKDTHHLAYMSYRHSTFKGKTPGKSQARFPEQMANPHTARLTCSWRHSGRKGGATC